MQSLKSIENDHLLRSKFAISPSFKNRFVIYFSDCLLDAELL